MLTKNKQNQRLWQRLFLLYALMVITAILTTPEQAQAQNVCQTTNPAPGATVLEWLADRTSESCGTRRDHLGVDIMLDTCVRVNIPEGCYIIMNGDSPIFGKWEGGYGYYMRFRCNENAEVRYAHIHGYDADAKQVINGYSGAAVESAPHVHYEIYTDGGSGPNGSGPRAADPECVWGDNDSATCCRGVSGPCLIGDGPVDLCNPTVLQQLSQNHDARQTGGSCNQPPWGYTSSDPIPAGVPPSAVPRGMHVPSDVPPGCGGSTYTGGPLTTTIDDEDPGSPDVIVHTGGTLTPPPEPGPPESGTPGGNPDLTPSSSATPDVTGCAADTWTAMVNQAVLEARRDSIMSQRLIAKADSVLTYTCFDQHVKITGQKVGPIFSETSDWVDRDVDIMGKTVTISRELGDTSLDGALTLAVDIMAAKYLDDNFRGGIGLLGETASVTTPAPTDCDVMKNVWKAAKCKNADSPFYTFQDLVGVDPRNMPASLQCGGAP